MLDAALKPPALAKAAAETPARRPAPSPRRRPLALAALAATATMALSLAVFLLVLHASSRRLVSPSPRGGLVAGPPSPALRDAAFPAFVMDERSAADDDDDELDDASPHCLRGRCSAYSFDAAAPPLRPAWMARLADATPLAALSVPGTHDTMTYGRLAADEQLQCQNSALAAQLDAGLRYFDIRARLRDDDLRIYHADGDTGFGLADVLRDMAAFLRAHPSEAIVMRLKEEGGPVGANNSLSFEQAFARHRSALLHPYDARRPLPTLGALRSKIFLLQEFAGPDAGPYGLEWNGPRMALEDDWIVADLYHLADKWVAIRTALERAATPPLDNSRLFLAHLSASVGVLPVDAAAGPRNRSVAGMNDITAQWLLDFAANPDVAPRAGIVIFDFPGRRAIDAVLAWNKESASP